MSTHTLHHLVRDYGCAVVFLAAALQALGPPVPATTVLAIAAVYAAAGHGPPIAGVIAAAAAGALTGTTAGFALGRWRGVQLLGYIARRLHRSPAQLQALRAAFAVRATTILLLGRFITGVRNVTGLVAGASAIGAAGFVTISAAAAIAWATISGLEYYWFGRALTAASGWVQVALVIAGIGWIVASLTFVRRRGARRLQGTATRPSE